MRVTPFLYVLLVLTYRLALLCVFLRLETVNRLILDISILYLLLLHTTTNSGNRRYREHRLERWNGMPQGSGVWARHAPRESRAILVCTLLNLLQTHLTRPAVIPARVGTSSPRWYGVETIRDVDTGATCHVPGTCSNLNLNLMHVLILVLICKRYLYLRPFWCEICGETTICGEKLLWRSRQRRYWYQVCDSSSPHLVALTAWKHWRTCMIRVHTMENGDRPFYEPWSKISCLYLTET